MSTFIHKSYAASIDRFGVESGQIVWHADTLEEARTCGAVVHAGLPLVNRTMGPGKASWQYLVTLHYEGQSQDGGAPPDPEVNETAEGEVIYMQEPIEKHPQLQDLLKRFGGKIDPQTNKVKWEPVLKPATSKTFGSNKNASNANPLYGRTTFAVTGSEVLHTFVRNRLPGDIMEKINQIIPELPSSIPSNGRPDTPKGRNWMIMAPRWISRGNVVQIFQRYRMSPPGGYQSELYSLLVK
jgi:hypothetical protein